MTIRPLLASPLLLAALWAPHAQAQLQVTDQRALVMSQTYAMNGGGGEIGRAHV